MTNDEIRDIIEQILLEFEPVFTKHGGGAELVFIEPEAVVLRIKGNCESCAMAPITFGLGIERMIKQKLPHIKSIKYVN